MIGNALMQTQTGTVQWNNAVSHSYFHLLLKEKSEYITVDMHQPLEITMQIVLKYMKDKSIFTKNDVITYLNALILLHQTNTDAISWKTE